MSEQPTPLKGKEQTTRFCIDDEVFTQDDVASAVQGFKDVEWILLWDPDPCAICGDRAVQISKDKRCVQCEIDYWFEDVIK